MDYLFLIQPYGNGSVINISCWLFSSILSILDEILFVWFLPSMCKSKKKFSFFLSFISISVSKPSLVFTQLKPPINVLANNLTCSASVGRAIQHLLLSLYTLSLNELVELHLRGLYLKISCKRQERRSNISHNIILSWKLYILLSSPNKFFTFSYSSSDITVSFKLEKKNGEGEKNPHCQVQFFRNQILLSIRSVLFPFLMKNN